MQDTVSLDGDPIDVLVADTHSLLPRTYINVGLVSELKIEDEHGADEKIIAVSATRLTMRYVHVANYADLPKITIAQVRHFFEHYKGL